MTNHMTLLIVNVLNSNTCLCDRVFIHVTALDSNTKINVY